MLHLGCNARFTTGFSTRFTTRLLALSTAVVLVTAADIPSAWALQALPDDALSASTGQDGISVKVAVSKVAFGHLSLIDKDGFAGATAAGALSMVPMSADGGIVFLQADGVTPVGSASNPLFTLTADTDGGTTNNAFLNLNVAFSNQLSKIHINPFVVGLTALSNGKAEQTKRRDILRSGTSSNADSGIDIILDGNNPLGMNIQLGSAPQGQLVRFKGNLKEIQANGLQLISYSNGTATDKSTTLQTDLNIKSTSGTGIDLGTVYATVKPTGLEIGASTLSNIDVTLNNTIMGQNGLAATDGTFNNLKNGSVGNIGLSGVTITGLKTTISGL